MTRPKGVTIFGCLFTFTGALGVFGALRVSLVLKTMPPTLYWVHIVLSVLFFICGVLLLKMHPQAWVFALFLFSVSLIANIIALVASKHLAQSAAARFQMAVMVSIGLSLIYDLYGLYYFTRAAVRQQFSD